MKKTRKRNKIKFYCIKCQKVTYNSTSVELKHDADTMNRYYCNCVRCSSKNVKDID